MWIKFSGQLINSDHISCIKLNEVDEPVNSYEIRIHSQTLEYEECCMREIFPTKTAMSKRLKELEDILMK